MPETCEVCHSEITVSDPEPEGWSKLHPDLEWDAGDVLCLCTQEPGDNG